MRIVVCVKHVPDVQGDRRFTDDGRVDRDQGDGTLNELDENAVEAALVIAEAVRDGGGDVETVAVTMGPEDAEDAVRRALQMGADTAVHVEDDALAGSDAFATARVLAAAVRRLEQDGPVDLVVTGMASLDGLMSVVPTLVAAELGRPQATLAAELTLTGTTLRARRELDDATEVVEVPLPAVASVTDQSNQPRYPNFQGIMAARKKPVTRWSLADLGVESGDVGEAAARTQVLEATERPPREDRVLVTDDGEAGTRLAQHLVEQRLV